MALGFAFFPLRSELCCRLDASDSVWDDMDTLARRNDLIGKPKKVYVRYYI